MSIPSIPDDPPRIHLRAWLLANGDPLRDLSLFASGPFEPYEGSHIQAPATEQRRRTAQLVTPSAALRELLTRCLLKAECRTLNAEEEGTETRQADATPPNSEDPTQRSAFGVQRSKEPDLVLLDLAAPNALARCCALREQHPDLPIVALTPLVSYHPAAWEAGANAVLPIPFDVLELHATIRVLLGADDA